MEKITVSIGEYVALNGGEQNFMTPVTFVGETLGKRVVYDEDEGRVTKTRGVTQTLYRVSDERLVVHTERWSQWQGEKNSAALREVTFSDLNVGGEFEALGRACGLCRDLTLDEALSMSES